MDRSKIIIFILAVLVLGWLLSVLLAHAQHKADGPQNAPQVLVNHPDVAISAGPPAGLVLAANPERLNAICRNQ